MIAQNQSARGLLVRYLALFLSILLAVQVSATAALMQRNETGDTTTAVTPLPEGSAPPKNAIPREPLAIIEALGLPFIAAFGVASVLALWFGIERLVQLRRRRVIPRHFVDRFLMHLRNGRMEPRQALAVCRENGSPIADIFAHGIRKWGKPSVEVEQAIIDGGERQVSHLRKHLGVLNGVATISPLIGLLGTVIGMIQAFNDIANSNAMGRAQELAVGIGLALLTTAVGLFIAIPALTLYLFLAGKVNALVMDMDRLSQNVVHLISAEALTARERATAKPVEQPQPPAPTSV